MSTELKKLKEMGCNAYRTSHNPPTPAILDACDKYGILVMDETRMMDTSPEYIEQLETMIRRDRNHPSVILWSIGNEEMNIHGTDIGVRIMNRLKRIANKLDPTRNVTYAMNGNWLKITQYNEEHGYHAQVNGLNYNILRDFKKYDELHKLYPNMKITGSENAGTASTRGLYSKDDEYTKNIVMNPDRKDKCIWEVEERKPILSAYGDAYPPWGSTPMETWTAVYERPFVAGVFIWTGFDYRGETNPYLYPCVVSHYGIMDLCGFPKDIYYYYKSWWTNEKVLHVFPHWNWRGYEGKEIEVCAFSNMDEVELFLNGKSQGKKKNDMYTRLTWKVKYTPGTLKAVGYKDGKAVIEDEVRTTKKASKLVIKPSKTEILADNSDVSVINIMVVDEDGNFVQTSNDKLKFKIEGEGKIIGTGNGNPMSHENDKLPERKAFYGLCQVIVQSTLKSGDIVFTAEGENIERQQITLKSKQVDDLKFVKKVEKDFKNVKVIGERDAADGAV